MASYRYRFLGKEALPSRMADSEAAEHCTLTPEQLAAVPMPQSTNEDGSPKRGRPPRDLRLGYAAQLVFLALTGRQAGTTDAFPRAMLKVLCQQLGLPTTAVATIKSIYAAGAASERALRMHRTWARDVLGFATFDAGAEAELVKVLDIRARDASTAAELISFAEEALYERRVVLPGATRLEELASVAFRAVENLALTTIKQAIAPSSLSKVLATVFEPGPAAPATVLEWLKQSAGKHGVKGLDEVATRITYLKEMGAADWDIGALSQTRIQAFAQAVINRPPSETARRSLDTRTVELICFLK